MIGRYLRRMEPSGHYTLKGTLGFWNRVPIKRYIRGNPPQSQLDSAAATPSRHPSEVGVCRPRGSLGGLWVAVSGGYKSPDMGCNCNYPTYDPTYNYR